MSFPGLAVRCLCAPAAVRLILLALLATPALGDFEPPPLPHTPEWQTWYDGLLAARLAACPRERATTYHFSQAGDDTAGNGSAQAPYRTLARARQVLAAHPGGDVALLFRRGDVWRETTGLIATAPNVTIAEYGDAALPKPLLSAFAPIPNPSAWAPLGALPNVYWRPMPGSISWVRETQDPDHPYWRVSSLLEVSAREGSWWWDQGTANLYIHPFHDGGAQATDPRTDGKPYEFVVPTWAGVVVSGNGSRIENLRAHGWGMWQVTPSQNHGIELRVVGEAQAVAVGCESYYGSSHAMTHLAGGMPGGVATFVNCKAGLCTYNAAGETVFNTYAHYGAQEVIFDHCEATHGTLPSSNFPAATVRRALGFYGHSIGPGYPVGLVVSHACSIRNRPYGCGGPSNFADLRAASSLADVRCFVMRELFEGGPGTGGNTLPLALTNAARVGGRYLALTPPRQATRSPHSRPPGGRSTALLSSSCPGTSVGSPWSTPRPGCSRGRATGTAPSRRTPGPTVSSRSISTSRARRPTGSWSTAC